MSENKTARVRVSLLPAIILPEKAFLPLSFWLKLKAETVTDYLALRYIAKGEITGIHQADYFGGPVVLIPGKLRPAVDKTVSSSRKTFDGIAVLAKIRECIKLADGVEYRAAIYQKIHVKRLVFTNNMHFAEIKNAFFHDDVDSDEAKEIKRMIIRMLNELQPFQCFINEKRVQKICEADSPLIFSERMIYHFNKHLFKEAGEIFSDEELVRYFNEPNTVKKLKAILKKLSIVLTSQKTKLEINKKVAAVAGSEQRKYLLRQSAQTLQNELDELQQKDRPVDDIMEKLKARIEAAEMPEEAEKMAKKQLERLKMIPRESPEYAMTLTYLDWLCDLPWNGKTEETVDIIWARQILNGDHYGLEKVKRRIIEHLAILKLKPNKKPPILCFVGPPGVGKTSLGKSIAHAMGRKFVRISLGGVRDEAEIRGHRRTYVGALPGRILQNIKRAGTKNAVFMLDEIDKLASDFSGDPASALLEVLDPEQNFAFSDHYLEVSYDLSPIFFICTANLEDPIPPALHDRMEFIRLAGYTPQEKYEIAKRFLIPKQMEENGVEKKGLKITDGALYSLVDNYTREAGVRNLEREIASAIRNRAVLIAQNKEFKTEIWASDLLEIFGPARFEITGGVDIHIPGVVTGLAWTEVGGCTLIIESSKMPRAGNEENLKYTGRLGDVMKESIEVAWDVARDKSNVNASLWQNSRIHLHVPEGATPKDGPSAGVAMTISLISTLSSRLVRPDLAMTGEITLRGGGTILPVGGIKEKLLAAHRAGYKYAFIPSQNEKDLSEVPDDVKREMEIMLAKNIDEVINFALQ